MRRFSAVAAALLLFSSHVAADFNDGVYALLTGEYDTALQHLVPLAETSDHAYAQYFLGRMYDRGQGVEQDYNVAAKWYRKASEKGVADAQYRLGNLYTEGTGVPRDLEYAYGWYSV
ncbi:MAG: sel1 repeat family protein, partial [Gammaproteobacteria bacterium]|nr:sel1 repeat family protein [Gammaproteobacteria bacterium]